MACGRERPDAVRISITLSRLELSERFHVADGVDQFQFLLAEEAVLEQRRFAAHAIDIACDGVDFTVVRDVAERLGKFPFGRGVGREPRMHQGECTFEGLLLQVEVIRLQLSRGQLPFVDEGLATQ